MRLHYKLHTSSVLWHCVNISFWSDITYCIVALPCTAAVCDVECAQGNPIGCAPSIQGGCCCCFRQCAQLLKKSAWLLHVIGDKAPPSARDKSEVPRVQTDIVILTPEADGLVLCLISSPPLSVGSLIQDATSVSDPRHRQFTTMRTLFTYSFNRE